MFRSEIFKGRNKVHNPGWENFGQRRGSFNFKVLFMVRKHIILHLGYRFEDIEWEETLLYVMASNNGLFGTGLMRFNEKQLYKKCI
jgi:hypothetical protein